MISAPQLAEFRLAGADLASYRSSPPAWEQNGLGGFVYRRTYSRNDDGVQETWKDTVQRVVQGAYEIQRRWITRNGLPWDPGKARASALEMYDRIYRFKMLPPGRGLWTTGTDVVMRRGLGEASFNCGYASTTPTADGDYSKPFRWAKSMLMVGVGVGFNTFGAGRIPVMSPSGTPTIFVVPDTREGWVESVGALLDSYFYGLAPVRFDYRQVRPKGAPIKTFGGIASGPAPLQQLHETIREILDRALPRHTMSHTDIANVMNAIGRAVVAGNVRRSAQIALGPLEEEFLTLKDPDLNGERLMAYGWASNNSAVAEVGDNYQRIAELIVKNGEPGIFWLGNARAYGRMGDEPNYRDTLVEGLNPCGEITLNSYELCNIGDVLAKNHDHVEDFKRTLKFLYLYLKTITLLSSTWPETNRVMLRNRRIGLSQTGVQQFVAERGIEEWVRWSRAGYDEIQRRDAQYSDWFAIPRSIKTTTFKPAGTTSLLAGATPGIHWPVADRYHIRRVRVAEGSPLLQPLISAGYPVEQDVYDPSSMVVEFPVDAGPGVRPEAEVSMWEQLEFTALASAVWADNSTSVTIKFDKATEGPQIEHALNLYDRRLKAVSFLPKGKDIWRQQPYESITPHQYDDRVAALTPIRWQEDSQAEGERYCDGDTCVI